MRTFRLAALILVCVASLASLPRAKAGDDAAARYAAAADYSAKFSGRAVLVMVGGKVVFERADNGWSLDRAHPLASGTKSFTGVMAMCAVQDGLLTLDEKASDTITEWREDALKREITVRQLLTLSSGLDPADEVLGTRNPRSGILGDRSADRKGDVRGARSARDKFAGAVVTPMKGTPGGQFEYGPSHFYAFGELLQRKLRASDRPEKTVLAYMRARVFEPIGLDEKAGGGRFGTDVAGNPNLPGGLRLTAQEWAKFGRLVVQGGTWVRADGSTVEVVRRELLEQCFVPSAKNSSYGLTWWLGGGDAGAVADGRVGDRRMLRQRREVATVAGRLGPDGKPLRVWMAAGLGKQRLYVLPQYDMVVVRFAELSSEGAGFDNAAFLKLILGDGGQ